MQDTNHTPEPPRTGNLDFLRDDPAPSGPEPVVPEDYVDFDPADLEINLPPRENPSPSPSVDAPTEIGDSKRWTVPRALLRTDLTNLDAALAIANIGAIVPTSTDGTHAKHPGGVVGSNWPDKATQNPAVITRWFTAADFTHAIRPDEFVRQVPFKSLGFALKIGKDLVAIDIDDPSAVPAHVWPHLDTAPFQSTSSKDTRRGHFLFRRPDGYRFSNSAIKGVDGKASPGEIRHGNAVIACAPSIHPKAHLGRRYQWVRDGVIPTMPDVVARWCESHTHTTHFNGKLIESTSAGLDGLEEFADTATGEAQPHILAEQINYLHTIAYGGSTGAIHSEAINIVVNTLAFAAHGYYSGKAALDALVDEFVTIRTDPASTRNQLDPEAAEKEIIDICGWALGRVREYKRVDPEAYLFHVASQVSAWYGITHTISRPAGYVEDSTPLVVPSPHVPMESARYLVTSHFTTDEHPTIRFWSDGWFQWRNGYWNAIDEHELRQTVYAAFEHARYIDEPDKPTKAWNPNRNKVANVIDALRGIVLLSSGAQPPSWPTGAPDGYPAQELLALRSGLLHLPTRTIHPHAPGYFNLNALDFEYDTSNTPPTEWLRFLESVWPDDPEAIATLQEWFGYVLSGRTDIQKMMLIQGPPRSGKGTIARILTELIGTANVAGPALRLIGTNFGLEGLIGKQLAIVSDAHLSRSASAIDIVENLKAISGEDVRTVDRKNKTSWTGRFPTRFMIMANELLKLVDNSGALASRFIVITMENSFIGHEDIGLTARLLEELPQILSWGLQGYDRVAATGTITEPASSLSAKNMLAVIGSPIKEFIDDCCTIADGAEVNTIELHQAYTQWCANQEVDHPQDSAIFGKSLNAVNPTIKRVDRRSGTTRWRAYSGIRLDN